MPTEAKMTSAPVNAKVLFADDTTGEVETVIVHRLSHKMTHVVVRGPAKRMRPDGPEHIARLVPMDRVARIDHGLFMLTCTMPEFLELDPFTEENVELVEFPDYQHSPIDSTGMPMGPTMMESYYVTEVTERIPEGELGVAIGTTIEATDGVVGRLAELVVTPDTGEVTHFMVEHSGKETSLPLSAIKVCRENVVYLNFDRKTFEQLPAVPPRPKRGDGPGTDIEMVALVFKDQAQADEMTAFVHDLHARHIIKIRNSAILAKAADGTITVKERHDWDAKNTALGGMIIGGVLGLMTGGIGIVAAPAIGAGLGAVTGRVVDRGFDDNFLKSLAEHLKPGGSGMLLIAESEWRVPMSEALKGVKGVILQHDLTDRLIAELTAEHPSAEDPPAEEPSKD
jgi:uncharacterized membrane protein